MRATKRPRVTDWCGRICAPRPSGWVCSSRLIPPVTHLAAVRLLALMLLNAARFPARLDADGRLLRLEDQDRSRWDAELIGRGLTHLARAADGEEMSEYHLQAAIAASHCTAKDYASTDWARIVRYYDQLAAIRLSPVGASQSRGRRGESARRAGGAGCDRQVSPTANRWSRGIFTTRWWTSSTGGSRTGRRRRIAFPARWI